MEALGNLILKIYSDLGLIPLLLLGLLVMCLYELLRCGSSYLKAVLLARASHIFPSRAKARLSKHVVFSKLDTLLNYRVKTMHISCPLRNKVFCDLLTIRISVVKEVLTDFAKADVDGLSAADFRQTVADRLQAMAFLWSTRALTEGIPAVVLDKFKDQNEKWSHVLDMVLLDQCLVTTTYQANTERLDTIFDMIGSFEIHCFYDVERTLGELNGEISSVSYKGIACNGCTPDCALRKHNNSK